MPLNSVHLRSTLRRFVESEASGGIVLIAFAGLALALANSPWVDGYTRIIGFEIADLSLEDWVNDCLMAVFFLLVGLEIKREMLHGQLRTWSARALPGLAALGGMAVPALIFTLITRQDGSEMRGWAVPSATDIAFALGVLSLLGSRVPASLKVFLTALAVLDDLGAVVIIALFYTGGLSWPLVGVAACFFGVLIMLNRLGVRKLWPYLVTGFGLWLAIWASGIHSTIAGVLLAVTIPAGEAEARREDQRDPLHRLEGALAPWVAYLILPVFAFVNAGVDFGQYGLRGFFNPVTVGVAAGLVVGKQAGVLASVWLAINLNLAKRPAGASWTQIYGVAMLCGIGFTMSLFIGLLAFTHHRDLQDDTKIGVLIGSVLSALAGLTILGFARRRPPSGPNRRSAGTADKPDAHRDEIGEHEDRSDNLFDRHPATPALVLGQSCR